MSQVRTSEPRLTWPDAAIYRLLSAPLADAPGDVGGVILCAGAGARMAPLTHALPKPLLPALNCPLLMWNIHHLSRHTRHICLNTHHLSTAFEPVRSIARNAGITISVVYEHVLSGPFGGALACLRHNTQPCDVIVLAGDGLYEVDLAQLLERHQEREADLTIGVAAVADGSRYGVLTVDDTDRVRAMQEKPANVGPVKFASCGVYVLARRVMGRFQEHSGPLDWVDLVTKLLREKCIVMAARVSRWLDAGVPSDLLALNLDLLNSKAVHKVANKMDHPRALLWSQGSERALNDVHCEDAVLIGECVTIEPKVSLANAVIGTGAYIGARAVVRNAVIMPGATVPPGLVVNDVVWS